MCEILQFPAARYHPPQVFSARYLDLLKIDTSCEVIMFASKPKWDHTPAEAAALGYDTEAECTHCTRPGQVWVPSDGVEWANGDYQGGLMPICSPDGCPED